MKYFTRRMSLIKSEIYTYISYIYIYKIYTYIHINKDIKKKKLFLNTVKILLFLTLFVKHSIQDILKLINYILY